MLWFFSSDVANLCNFRVWRGANLRLLPLLLLWALKNYFSVFLKTILFSFTCVPRWFPGQSLRENFFLTRNAVDRSYRHCHLSFRIQTVDGYKYTLFSLDTANSSRNSENLFCVLCMTSWKSQTRINKVVMETEGICKNSGPGRLVLVNRCGALGK